MVGTSNQSDPEMAIERTPAPVTELVILTSYDTLVKSLTNCGDTNGTNHLRTGDLGLPSTVFIARNA